MSAEKWEPTPRSFFFAATVEGKLMIWGGLTELIQTEELDEEIASAVEIFDPYKEEWLRTSTYGAHPPRLLNGACASVGHNLYVYGGCRGAEEYGRLYQLDTRTLTWTLLAGYTAHGPRKKTACQMIPYEDRLVLFGGCGPPHGSTQPVLGDVEEDTNELHLFDLEEGKINKS